MPITQTGSAVPTTTIFETSGQVATVNNLVDFKNGLSTLRIQGERNNQQTDRYFVNWVPDTSLNPTLTTGGLNFGYEQGSARVALNNSDIVFNRNNSFISAIGTTPSQAFFYVPAVGGLRVFSPSYSGHIIAFSPYTGLKVFGFGGSGTLVDVGENTGCIFKNYNASVSGLTLFAANNQTADLLQFKNSTGTTKLAVSGDFKINFPISTNAPSNTTTPIGWVEVKVDGQTAYIPAYR